MITKGQARHLAKLIEMYTEARENKYWQDDQGWIGSEIEQAKQDCLAAKERLDAYMRRITEK